MKQGSVHPVAIVGMGLMGRRHARVLSELTFPPTGSEPADAKPRFALVGVVDADAARAAEAAKTWNVHAFDDVSEAIARAEIVVVATPIVTHAALAIRVLEAGRHVFVEKPVCANVDDAQALVAAATRAKRHLFVGHSERFNPVVRALARLLRGEEVVAIELHRIGAARAIAVDEPGVLVNLGVHDFDLASYLTSSHVEVRDAVGRPLADAVDGRATHEDLAHVLVGTASGAVGHIYVDRTARARHRTVRVTTRRWIFDGDLLSYSLVRTARATGDETDVPLLADEPLVAQATALADVLDGATSREIATGADGVRALTMAEQALARIRAAREATIADGAELRRAGAEKL